MKVIDNYLQEKTNYEKKFQNSQKKINSTGQKILKLAEKNLDSKKLSKVKKVGKRAANILYNGHKGNAKFASRLLKKKMKKIEKEPNETLFFLVIYLYTIFKNLINKKDTDDDSDPYLLTSIILANYIKQIEEKKDLDFNNLSEFSSQVNNWVKPVKKDVPANKRLVVDILTDMIGLKGEYAIELTLFSMLVFIPLAPLVDYLFRKKHKNDK